MSEHDAHSHDDHAHGDSPVHFSLKGYATGFVLSLILTAIPFWLVMNGVIASAGMTAAVILGFAAVQVELGMTLAITSQYGMAVSTTDSRKPVM